VYKTERPVLNRSSRHHFGISTHGGIEFPAQGSGKLGFAT
jgi:hypothetical protein